MKRGSPSFVVITVRSHRVSWGTTQIVYLWTLAQEMPTAYPVRRRKSNNFQPESVDKFGRFSREWLEWVVREKNITLRHKSNNKEKTLGDRHLRVDGWDAENNTVYRFHRSFFHGYDCHKTEGCGDVNLFNKKSILRTVYDGRLFGLVRCDIAVPESLRAHFSEMPPIFKNIEVSREDIGSFMGKYVDEHKLLSQPLSRNGDIDPAKVILAETFKLLGNSAYGKSIENLENPRDVVYSTSEKSWATRQQPLFQNVYPA
ncbi:hypothetical protein RRG08_065874 [Elysia crispata]|uniref:DNA-directed DNA polymerase n=1 Tax=Elysia crispata TaxID=231223 RepID=A0AAE1A9L6_9GAST|nr:hypothetical protein RRG08_065874 [Elysia crispata]